MPNPENHQRSSEQDFIQNPHIEDFIKDIRSKDKPKNPFLIQQQEIANGIMSQLSELEIEKEEILEKYPDLGVRPIDQFVLTPYDDLENLQMAVPPEILLRAWEIERNENLFIANHPARLFTMRQMEDRGFIAPPELEPGVLDKQLAQRELVQLDDLGQNRQLLIKRREADHPQVHRTPFLAVGPLSYMGRRVRSFVGVGAMSDITGSILAGVTLSKMHVLWCVPKDGKYSNPDIQAEFVKTVISELNNPDDPLLAGRSEEEKEEIIERWITSMVVSLEGEPSKALKRFEKAYAVGAKSARPYQHTGGIELVHTVRDLRNNFREIEIFASQLSSKYIALRCEEEGADAGIPGVGSGGRCTTARLAGLTPTNAHLPWILRGQLKKMPLLGEGGAVNNPVISALVGMTGVLGSGSLGGGTFEAPGGMFFFTSDGGKTHKKGYRGEASRASKKLGGKTYSSGASSFAEGEGTYRNLDPFSTSITSRIRDVWEAVIVGATDLGLDGNNPDIIGQMQRLDPSPLTIKTLAGTQSQNTH